MKRCPFCDAILRKEEQVCFLCGDEIPRPAKTGGSGMLFALGVPLLAFLSYWLLSGRTF